jgi:hypothetical protein
MGGVSLTGCTACEPDGKSEEDRTICSGGELAATAQMPMHKWETRKSMRDSMRLKKHKKTCERVTKGWEPGNAAH